MARVNRHTGLAGRIPEDVYARIQRAGVDDVDWYAGRLDVSDDLDYSAPQDRDLVDLRTKARSLRKTERRARARSVSAFVSALMRNALRRVRPIGR